VHRYSTVSDDTEVLLYSIVGGSHDWPEKLGAETTSSVIWNFFKTHIGEGIEVAELS
jgi:poly(3-hydroxybutyrate) depolymerase